MRRKGEEVPCANPLAGRGRKRVAHEHLRMCLTLPLFLTMGFVRSPDALNQVQIENHFIPGATSRELLIVPYSCHMGSFVLEGTIRFLRGRYS